MLKNTFCSSPWFHLRKTYDGTYEACRWANKQTNEFKGNAESMMQFYNGDQMRQLRQDLLSGKKPSTCEMCYYQGEHHKLSGREKQLLKSGVTTDDFERSMLASSHFEHFRYSQDNQGLANYYPVDLQIDLGNVCNSACIMCLPFASSRLETEYPKLTKQAPDLFPIHFPKPQWTNDPAHVEKFCTELASIPGIKYIHLLGGETLVNPSFYSLCDALIKTGASKEMIIGTTTNGTIYDRRLESIISEFKQVHIGFSIESITTLNDYVRWPSKINRILENLHKFVDLRKKVPGLTVLARLTPNIFTIHELDLLLDYLFDLGITAESCNILYTPASLRMENMPDDIRVETIDRLQSLVDRRQLSKSAATNHRCAGLEYTALSNITIEYLEFVKGFHAPDDVENQRKDLVRFLKAFETQHRNSILDHAPRYTEFLRTYGY